jgi:hypothetical protein
MKRIIFIFAVVLALLCNTGVKSQSEDLEKRTQEKMLKTVDWLYDSFKDFDRECFLAGTLGGSNGHYQTFTANQSSDEINYRVKWMFEKDLKFIPDTMRRQRITSYGLHGDVLALFVIALFKNDYPDLRALRVCSICPFVRHYGSEIKTAYDSRDPVCNNTTDYDIELFSSSLAKTVEGYCHFEYDNVLAVSSGGDIGYGGFINREKIATEAQKMSFLAGVFLRYGGYESLDGSNKYSINIPHSLNTAKECIDLLKEFGCDNVEEIQTKYKEEFIGYNASDKIRNLLFIIHDLYDKMAGVIVAY